MTAFEKMQLEILIQQITGQEFQILKQKIADILPTYFTMPVGGKLAYVRVIL